MKMFIVRHVSHFVLGEDERKASICASPLCGVECAGDLRHFRRQDFDGARGGLSHHFCKGGFTEGCFHHGGDQCCSLNRNFALFYRLNSSGAFWIGYHLFRAATLSDGRERTDNIASMTVFYIWLVFGISYFGRVRGDSDAALRGDWLS